MITQLGQWTQDAACATREYDPTWWDPDAANPYQLELAARICSTCPVRRECREDAEADLPHGAQIRAGRVYGYGGADGDNPPLVGLWLGSLTMRSCTVCDAIFMAPKGGRRYCSEDCADKGRPAETPGVRFCAGTGCGEEFTPTNPASKYCSARCKTRVRRARERARAAARRAAA